MNKDIHITRALLNNSFTILNFENPLVKLKLCPIYDNINIIINK